jgi:hypothetical protein
MLVVAALPGLKGIRWPGLLEGFFYEMGLLAFLAGVGLFLLSMPSSSLGVQPRGVRQADNCVLGRE